MLMSGPLKKFCTAKYLEVEHLRELQAARALPEPFRGKRPGFSAALRLHSGPLAVIAEYKRASPSCGVINSALTPETVAQQYYEAGAACLSVLTEEHFFQGELGFIDRMAALPAICPLLRKDFIFDPLQIEATAATRASALLLIVGLTPNVRLLRHLRSLTEHFGMEAVFEVFNLNELQLARKAGARLIQVNARNLATLQVCREQALQLAQRHRGSNNEEIWIAASGISCKAHLQEAADAGFNAALVGTSLMSGGEPGKALGRLLGA